MTRWRPGFALGWMGLSMVVLAGCQNPEGVRARTVATPRLRCTPDEMEVVLNRETSVVREWVVACDLMYTRIHCTDRGCQPAPPKPPCVGDLPCFKEDPVTLRWELEEPQSRLARAAGSTPTQ